MVITSLLSCGHGSWHLLKIVRLIDVRIQIGNRVRHWDYDRPGSLLLALSRAASGINTIGQLLLALISLRKVLHDFQSALWIHILTFLMAEEILKKRNTLLNLCILLSPSRLRNSPLRLYRQLLRIRRVQIRNIWNPVSAFVVPAVLAWYLVDLRILCATTILLSWNQLIHWRFHLLHQIALLFFFPGSLLCFLNIV